jgi:putative copper resistance protein D
MQDGLILCRFVHFAAVLLLFGVGVFRQVLFARWLHAFEASPGRGSLERALGALTAIALISATGWLMLTAANMADDWRDAIDPQTISLVLSQTFFGRVWIIHLLLNLSALLLAWRWGALAPRAALLLNTLLLLTLAPVGHGAMYDGTQGQLLILNQMLHLLGTGTWLGGLLMLGMLLTCATVDVRSVLSRFSGIGYALVAVIIVTGMINVRALSGALWPAPALSGFGLVLAVKLLMVLCMLLLAAVNRSLARQPQLRLSALRASVLLEGVFGAAALAAVSLLGTLPPMLV